MSEQLAAVLDQARWVEFDPNGYCLAWFGGHGLHVYSVDGQEVDYRSVGDFSQNSASLQDVRDACRAWRNEAEATCGDCSGTRSVPNLYGEPELCRTCSTLPDDPFVEQRA